MTSHQTAGPRKWKTINHFPTLCADVKLPQCDWLSGAVGAGDAIIHSLTKLPRSYDWPRSVHFATNSLSCRLSTQAQTQLIAIKRVPLIESGSKSAGNTWARGESTWQIWLRLATTIPEYTWPQTSTYGFQSCLLQNGINNFRHKQVAWIFYDDKVLHEMYVITKSLS